MNIKELKQVYFICNGNTCRSPMAERELQGQLAIQGIEGIAVGSRRGYLSPSYQAPNPIQLIGVRNYGSNVNAAQKVQVPYARATMLGGYITPERRRSRRKDFFDRDDVLSFRERISSGTAAIIYEHYQDLRFIKSHVPKDLTLEEADQADLIITVTASIRDNLLNTNKIAFTEDGRLRIYTLGELSGRPEEDVQDPFMLRLYPKANELKERLGSKLSSDLNNPGQIKAIEELFGSVEVYLNDLNAYTPTYHQIKEMINSFLKKGTFKDDNIASLFERYLGQVKENLDSVQYRASGVDDLAWYEHYPRERRFGKLSRGRIIFGDISIDEFKEELREDYFQKAVHYFDDLVDNVRKSLQELVEKPVVENRRSDLSLKMRIDDISALETTFRNRFSQWLDPEFSGSYLNKVRNKKIFSDLAGSTLRIADHILPTVEILKRDAALDICNETVKLLDFLNRFSVERAFLDRIYERLQTGYKR